MTLTLQQWRARADTARRSLIVKMTIPGDGDYYIARNTEPFEIPGVHVNDSLLGIDGLDMGSFEQVSDIRLRLTQKKLCSQAGNPLVTAVHLSDKIADGMNRATIEVKELIATVPPITVTSWTSDDLQGIFKGLMRTPFAFDEETFTIAATALEQKGKIEIPTERIGEHDGTSLEGDQTVVPIHFGNNDAWIGYLGTHPRLEGLAENVSIGRHLRGTVAPVWEYPATTEDVEATLVASQYGLDIDELMIDLGFPAPCVIPKRFRRTDTGWQDQWAERTEGTYGYKLIDLMNADDFYAYYAQRCSDNPRTSLGTYRDWEDLATPYGSMNLALDDRVALATPSLGSPEKAKFHTLLFYVPIIGDMPEGSLIEYTMIRFDRAGTASTQIASGTWAPGDITAGGLWTTFDKWVAAEEYLPGTWGSEDRDSKFWNGLVGDWGVRFTLKRTGSAAGNLTIGGIYALVFFRQGTTAGRKKSLWQPRLAISKPDELELSFGTGGNGVAATYEPTTKQAHPRHLFFYLLVNELDATGADIDFGSRSEFRDTENWRMGFGMDASQDVNDLLRDLEDQSTLMLCKDSDGKYRLRMKARYGGKPEWQRFDHDLVYRHDYWDLKVSKPGPNWVKNIITVQYAPDMGGSQLLSAWVAPNTSGDGWGNSDSVMEGYSNTSVTDYGKQRETVSASMILDPATATGLRNWKLARHAQEPFQLEFRMKGLGAFLHAGQYVRFASTSIDTRLKLGGGSWWNKWFQIDRKTRWGESWKMFATQCPDIQLRKLIVIFKPWIVKG